MKTIHKQILEIKDTQLIELPYGSDILSVANQNEQLCIWYEFCLEHITKSKFVIYILGTGHKIINEHGNFIGTVLMANGSLVWHVFVEEI